MRTLHQHLACALCDTSPARVVGDLTLCEFCEGDRRVQAHMRALGLPIHPTLADDARLFVATELLREALGDWERAGTIRVWTEASIRHFLSAEKALAAMTKGRTG